MNIFEVRNTTFTTTELDRELRNNGYSLNDFVLWAANKGVCTLTTIIDANGFKRLKPSIDIWEGEDFLEFMGY